MPNMTAREKRGPLIVKKIGSFIVCFLWVWEVFSQFNIQATVDRNRVGVGEAFTLRVTLSSEGDLPSAPPKLPVINHVQLVHSWSSSRSQSTMVSTGQGMEFKTLRSKIYNYQYSATKAGAIRIDPIGVKMKGREYSTKPIVIRVSQKGVATKAPKGRRRPSPPTDPFHQMDQFEQHFQALLNRQFGQVPGSQSYQTEPRNAKEAFFILVEVDKTQAYKGEQILASWYLYTRGRVRDIDTLKYPTLKGFWKEDIQISTQLNFEQDVVNGIPYNRALLASYALFPIEVGKQVVDAYKARATIVGGFGFTRGFQATKVSDRIPILIKPLPLEGKPEDFTGAVGEFQMSLEAPSKTILTHQPFALKIRFEGWGNAKLIELPKLPLGENLEVYDITNESRFFKNGQSFKEFEVLLIPKQAGPLVIDSLTSSFFDPKKGKYISLKTEPVQLRVFSKAKQQSIGEERIQSDQEKKSLPEPLSQWDSQYEARPSFLFIWPFLFILALVVLILKAILDSGLLRKDPSLEELMKDRFEKIDRLLKKSQVRKLGIEATNTVYLVLGDLSGQGGASEELDKILRKIAPSVRREIETPIKKLMDYFGVLGFGPDSYVRDFKDQAGLKKKVAELKNLLLLACRLSRISHKV